MDEIRIKICPDDIRIKKCPNEIRIKMCPDEIKICQDEIKICPDEIRFPPTILILEKLRSPSSVKLGVPSSMKLRSVRYIPRYGMQGGSHLWRASRRLRKRPSEQTSACSLSRVWRVCESWNLFENCLYCTDYCRIEQVNFFQSNSFTYYFKLWDHFQK